VTSFDAICWIQWELTCSKIGTFCRIELVQVKKMRSTMFDGR
jgi:hypothetical protein